MKVSNKFHTYRSRNVEQVEAYASVGSDRNYPDTGVRLTCCKSAATPTECVEMDLSNEDAMVMALELIRQAESNRDTYRKYIAAKVQP